MTPLTITYRATAALVPYANNARTHDESQVKQIAASVKEFGFTNPVLVDSSNGIIAGHGRVMAAQLLGMTEVPCIELPHLTDAQRRAYILADNQIALKSGWNLEMLTAELDRLSEEGFSPEMLAFSEDDLQAIADAIGEGKQDDTIGDDEVPDAPAESVSKRGEIYELGPHRLMCGDSTSAEDWAELMQGEIGDAVMTDPPYGVDYVGGDRNPCRNSAYSGDTVENDSLDQEKQSEMLNKCFSIIVQRTKDGGSIYVAHADTAGHIFREAFIGAGFKLAGCIIWAKSSFVFGRSDYKWQHEPILYGWKHGAAHTWHGPTNETTLWDYRRPIPSDKQHPTMKPVELYERMMNNSTAPGELVLEPFCGSGTTLIACAKTGRVCRAMEIAPRYCDVIRKRWTRWAKENKRDPGPGALE